MDIYEKERWYNLALVFALSCISFFIVYPITDIFTYDFNFHMTGNPGRDFIYSVIGIGAKEELVKILPVFAVMLIARKAINEPYDFILYSAVSALAFAFIENIGYINDEQMYNINVRGVYSVVGHMIDSSIIGYGLMLGRYWGKNTFMTKLRFFGIFFLLGSLSHGIYDFWLLNEWALNYSWVTDIWLLFTIYVWFVMINNCLNISNFYTPRISVKNDAVKFQIIVGMIFLMMFSFVTNSYALGSDYGWNFMLASASRNLPIILFLAFSLSRFEIVRGYLAPITKPMNVFLPKPKPLESLVGKKVMLYTSKQLSLAKKLTHLRGSFPISGEVVQRVVISGDTQSYLIKLDRNLDLLDYLPNKIVVKSRAKNEILDEEYYTVVNILVIKSVDQIDKMMLSDKDFKTAGQVMIKVLD